MLILVTNPKKERSKDSDTNNNLRRRQTSDVKAVASTAHLCLAFAPFASDRRKRGERNEGATAFVCFFLIPGKNRAVMLLREGYIHANARAFSIHTFTIATRGCSTYHTFDIWLKKSDQILPLDNTGTISHSIERATRKSRAIGRREGRKLDTQQHDRQSHSLVLAF